MKTAHDQFPKEARPVMVNEDAPMSATHAYHERHAAQMSSGATPRWVVPEL